MGQGAFPLPYVTVLLLRKPVAGILPIRPPFHVFLNLLEPMGRLVGAPLFQSCLLKAYRPEAICQKGRVFRALQLQPRLRIVIEKVHFRNPRRPRICA